jgi:putative tricarboxylic transport membrane protein
MQPDMIASAVHALHLLLEPARLMILFLGVLIGLAIGVLPGLNGIVGLAMLIPFTYNLDEYTAFALLLGMAAVITSSDFITAVLFGVPGHVGAAATVIDGHEMAKKGEAGRAFGAGFAASLVGGIVGAVVLAVSIPVLRPIMLSIGSPELLAFTLFGMSMVATLSGRAPLKGLTAAGLGLMIAMIGSRAQSGTLRWTFGWLYLWDGMPLIPATLGIFALPELAELAFRESALPATTRPRSISPANGRAYATWRETGGWCCAAACSAPGSARSRASAPPSSIGSPTATRSAPRRTPKHSAPATCAA